MIVWRKLASAKWEDAWVERLAFIGPTRVIITALAGANVGIFLNRVHNIKAGDLAYVFRQDDEYVGSIRFKKAGGIMTAETVSLENGAGMQPFDRIMLNKIEKKP